MAKFIAVTSSGLEDILFSELSDLGVKRASLQKGGVSFEGPWSLAYRVSSLSRVATRVMLPVLDFSAYKPEDIYYNIQKHDFTKYITADQTLKVTTNGSSSIFRDTMFVSLKVKDAVVDQFTDKFSVRPSVDKVGAHLCIMVRLYNEKLSVSIDIVGRSLSQRGYRVESVRAPLREHLAAGLLKFSGWEPGVPLLDPMCGSGTFLFEAAYRELGWGPQKMNQNFVFTKLLNFQKESFDELNAEILEQEVQKRSLKLYGSDISLECVNKAMENAQRIGLKRIIKFNKGNALNLSAPSADPGVIICNPPYGERLSDSDEVIQLFADWSEALKKNFPGWTLAIISAQADFTQGLKMKCEKKMGFKNGDMDCKFLVYKIR